MRRKGTRSSSGQYTPLFSQFFYCVDTAQLFASLSHPSSLFSPPIPLSRFGSRGKGHPGPVLGFTVCVFRDGSKSRNGCSRIGSSARSLPSTTRSPPTSTHSSMGLAFGYKKGFM
ncbi:hypothetical protein TNCT_707581 [Trichonephila clavata]|uniref:Uncharacterized protein n=1 Tax=Trichonephila clavata TaxID=2740835 RepID=A0A8X6HL07_TRICU|nr:hypothetical protein TNCT_707581 [Trichonephila clavata]